MNERCFTAAIGVVAAAGCVTASTGLTSTPKAPALDEQISGWRRSIRGVSCHSISRAQEDAVSRSAALARELLTKATKEERTARLVEHLSEGTLSLSLHMVGRLGAAAIVVVSCNEELDSGETWIISFRRTSAWEELAREKQQSMRPIHVIASGTRSPRFALIDIAEGMGHSIATLEIRTLSLAVHARISNRWDPNYVQKRNTAVVSWLRVPDHLQTEIDGPGAISEEAVIDLDADHPVVARSLSPWINAVDSQCADTPASVFCDGGIAHVDGTDMGRDVTIDVETPVSCAVTPSPRPLRWNEDARVVVTTSDGPTGWHIVQVRPENRECSVYGFRAGKSNASALVGATAALRSRAYVVSAQGAALLVGAGSELLEGDFARTHSVLGGIALRDVAFLSDGSPAWIDADGNVATLRFGKVVVVAEDADAMGLVGCGSAICWSAYDSGEVRQWRDGSTTVLATGAVKPLGIAYNDGDIFVAAADGILVLRAGSRSFERFGAAVAPLDVAAHGGTIVWAEANGRVVVSYSNSRLQRYDGGRPAAIALGGGFLYWVDATDGSLHRVKY